MATKKEKEPAKRATPRPASAITLPPNVKTLPVAAQSLYKKGAAAARKPQDRMRAGWAEVKKVYTKDETTGKWKKRG